MATQGNDNIHTGEAGGQEHPSKSGCGTWGGSGKGAITAERTTTGKAGSWAL